MAKTTLRIIFAVVLVAVFAVGCENDRTTAVAPSNDLVFLPDKSNNGPFIFDPSYYLDIEFLNSLKYEEFSGSLVPGIGALLIGEMKTWPGGGDFAINIPPEALPDDDPTYETEFSIRIPTYESYLRHPQLPLIVWLEPSDVNFLVPLTVMCTYMPWTKATVDDVYEYFCMTPLYEEFGPPTVYEIDGQVKLQFQAHHFSIWGVGGPVDEVRGNHK